MKNNKQRLVKWVESMGFELEQSIGISDDIVQKMLKPCAKLKLNPDYVLGKALGMYNCQSLIKLKENINYILKKEIMKGKRVETEYIIRKPSISKETLEAFRSKIPLKTK